MNNLDYFKFSLENPDDIIDFSNPMGCIVVAKNQKEHLTNLQIAYHKLTDLIITYKTLKSKKKNQKIVNDVLQDIIKLLTDVDLINYTPFCVYFQVLKYSYSSYINDRKKMEASEELKVIQQIIDTYLKYRHDIYSFYGYNDIVLQIMSDISSSRRNGKTGIKKLEDILLPLSYRKAHKLEDFKNNQLTYILPDKDGKKLFQEILKEYNIDFQFFHKRDAKYPDILLKSREKIYIIEHKMINGSGGSQNEEVNEIIDFIGYPESNPHVYYISCLNGNYMTELNKSAGKTKAQKNRIIKHLGYFGRNYFVNGSGFKKLLEEVSK